MLILTDFDGTVTVQDVTNLIWDVHIPFDWRARWLPRVAAGEMSALELIGAGYGHVHRSAEELLDEIRPRVTIREGFDRLRALAASRGWPFYVVSHGLPFYLTALLPEGVAAVSFAGRYDGSWRVTLPEGFAPPPGADFKVHVLGQLKEKHPGHSTVYIGDGRLDLPVARVADWAAAIRGSVLAGLCREAGMACLEITSFDEVTAALSSEATSGGRPGR